MTMTFKRLKNKHLSKKLYNRQESEESLYCYLMNNYETSNILYWNIRSANANKTDIYVLMKEFKPNVIALTETWIKPNKTLNIKGYVSICENRKDGKGGIAILIKKKIKFTKRNQINFLNTNIQ